ncbi:hypothetical protein AB0H58_02555 [Nocardia neocaledoniensis]|uniref:hypothetical protein n=1 Tax=Nocardia neocaledoniensis TaxID=236511 RepID=UPI0034093EFF
MDTDIGRDPLHGHCGVVVAGDLHDIVAELSRLRLGHCDIPSGSPHWSNNWCAQIPQTKRSVSVRRPVNVTSAQDTHGCSPVAQSEHRRRPMAVSVRTSERTLQR